VETVLSEKLLGLSFQSSVGMNPVPFLAPRSDVLEAEQQSADLLASGQRPRDDARQCPANEYGCTPSQHDAVDNENLPSDGHRLWGRQWFLPQGQEPFTERLASHRVRSR